MGEQFILPLGLIKDGTVHRDIELIPMTAGTRRILTQRAGQKSPSTAMTNMLGQCTTRIGGEPPTPHLLNSLTTGDRDFILMKLRLISIGPTVKAKMTCPKCQEEISFDLDIEKLNVVELEHPRDFEIDGSCAVTRIKSTELGLDVALRFPTGFDQLAIADTQRSDPLGASYALYARLIKSWSEHGKLAEMPNTLKFIDGLSIRAIEWLEDSFRKKLPGPDWMVPMACELCGKSTLLDLSDTDFLFKTPR
jgi:hypothetical protein